MVVKWMLVVVGFPVRVILGIVIFGLAVVCTPHLWDEEFLEDFWKFVRGRA